MKNIRTTMLCACVALASLSSLAQVQNKAVPVNEPNLNKPKLFANLPDRISVNATDIDNLFDAPLGRPANLKLATDLQPQLEGEVVSVSQKTSEGIQSIVIRTTNYNGARLMVSRVSHPDGTVSYTGRIISFQHGDAYELQTQAGQLTLVKKNFYDLVNE